MSFLSIFTFFSVLVSVATAVRFDLTNVTCKGLHGPHCGTYVMEVVGQNGTFLGQSTFVGADVLTESAGDAWARYLGQETRFLPKLTTIASNDTKNFSPLIFTTNIYTCNPQSIGDAMVPFANTVTGEIEYNSWADTADNASFITGLANQLFNSTQYGVQVASCYPNFASVILSTPTVNIFAANETLPDYCTAIQLKAVCPPDAGFD
ncbi:BFH_HP2_G0017350.mRNA.1.CDS.1 [Saccharomyces cerevisiae]|nr:BFH_HP2_G0017350.mRNA.1.CDS.1 [Saccharomyces cerevisiae]CAI6496646.1 BFH_HP2_G0017350.mRNA.1.CDS.1 [Saccharomyces cerevisiae]